MKKLLILPLLLLLTSCGMTQEEKLNKIKECEELGGQVDLRRNGFGTQIDCEDKEDKVIICIKEYTNGLDEKYNNPDYVNNLREDNYSEVVKACNEIFGEKCLNP